MIDGWIAFANLEPEAFAVHGWSGPGRGKESPAAGASRMVSAAKAFDLFAKKYSR